MAPLTAKLTFLGYATVMDARDHVATEIRSMEAGARATEGFTLDTLRRMQVKLESVIKAHRKFIN